MIGSRPLLCCYLGRQAGQAACDAGHLPAALAQPSRAPVSVGAQGAGKVDRWALAGGRGLGLGACQARGGGEVGEDNP